jgi:hypothetical protein
MKASSLLFLVLVLLFAAPALSRNGFEASAYRVMRLERVPQSALGKADCQICHVNPKGDAPWNAFGLAVGFWRGKKQNVPDAVYSALRYGGDTDRDGYPNTFEAMAGTNPNDRDDKPGAKLEALKARFDAQFKLEADADGDGFADALEAWVGTLPGDAESRPTVTKDVLQQQFEAAGGLKLFDPSSR